MQHLRSMYQVGDISFGVRWPGCVRERHAYGDLTNASHRIQYGH